MLRYLMKKWAKAWTALTTDEAAGERWVRGLLAWFAGTTSMMVTFIFTVVGPDFSKAIDVIKGWTWKDVAMQVGGGFVFFVMNARVRGLTIDQIHEQLAERGAVLAPLPKPAEPKA